MRSYESIVKPITMVSKNLLKLIDQAQAKRNKHTDMIINLSGKKDALQVAINRAEATAKKLEALVS